MVPDMVLKPKQEPHKHLGINWTQLKYPKYHLATQVIKKSSIRRRLGSSSSQWEDWPKMLEEAGVVYAVPCRWCPLFKYTTICVNLINICWMKEARHREYIPNDFIYMKFKGRRVVILRWGSDWQRGTKGALEMVGMFCFCFCFLNK